jgi:hypothetical protein
MTHWIVFLAMLFAAAEPQDPYAPLRLYQGSWTVTRHDTASGKTITDSLVNACSQVGLYYACQQTVNGKAAALVVYIPDGSSGHYFTHAVLPDGNSPGRGELTITGSHWVYLGHSDGPGGATTWFRTTNDFDGRDHIRFESAQSPDGKTWTVTGGGEDTRTAAAH